AEEQRPEHGHPEQECSGEGLGVDARGRNDVRDVPERVTVADPVEGDESDRQQADDDEHLAPQRLPQAVARDRQRRGHSVSPPTASTETSSSVDVRTRTPYTFRPPPTTSATTCG